MTAGALEQLAQAYDIQISYRDLDDKEVRAPRESLVAALKAMGAVESANDAPAALRRYKREHWRWSIDPVAIVWRERLGDGQAGDRGGRGYVRVRLPESALAEPGRLRIELEDGEVLQPSLRLDSARVTDSEKVGRERCVELSVALPPGLPYGYHRLTVEIGGRQMASWAIVTPRRVHAAGQAPSWGVFLPLYALHSGRSWGIGDYTDLRHFVEWAGSRGAGLVGSLPLLPTFLEEPFAPSPYEPVSRLFWNEVFIDPEAPLENGRAPAVDPGLAAEARRLLASPDVDYGAVMQLKRRALQSQAESLDPESEDGLAMTGYLAARPELRDYAAFRAAVERLGPDWRRWPERQRGGELPAEDYDAGTARYFEYAQWRAHCQMREAAGTAASLDVRSYLDLPVGVHQQGYDAWRHQDIFAQGLTVGAPPDLLSTHGQNWGFQPLLPDKLRASGYDYMVRYLRHYFACAKMLRIDHAIGLHRLFWIPEGAPARDGVFVRQPAEELYAVLCLESMRYQALIVGEDLGLVPPEVRKGLRRHGISGMYVQMFEMTGRKERPQKAPRAGSIASFSTHDLPTFAGYWEDDDLRQREKLGLLAPEKAAGQRRSRVRHRNAMAGYLMERGLVTDGADIGQLYRGSTALLAESDAEWVLLNLEDTWGEPRPQNLPGTTSDNHPNWVSRAAHGLEAFDDQMDLDRAISTVKLFRDAGRRAGQTMEAWDGGRQASIQAAERR